MPEPVAEDEDADVVDDAQLERAVASLQLRTGTRRAGRYSPTLRQLPPDAATAKRIGEGSWWMRPDADWKREAERMMHGKNVRIPSAHHVIGT